MSEVEYTPGPWKVEQTAGMNSTTVGVKDGFGRFMRIPIAHRVLSQNGIVIVADTGLNYPLCEHNARLIAAAPDLLEALGKAAEFVGIVEAGERQLRGREHTVHRKFTKGHALMIGNIIRTAIAKAEPNTTSKLIDAACEAEETFGLDELEKQTPTR